MGRTYLLFIVGAGVLGSMLSNAGPGSGNSNPAVETQDAQRPDPGDGGYEEQDHSYAGADVVELERQADGHFYAEVEVNNMPIRFLVDTGASGVALSRDAARRAGLAVSTRMNDVVGRGASGDVHGEFVMLDRVSLGSETARNVPAVILDGSDESLLGQSFLERFDSVEIKDDRMILR